jgi:pyroglutamyl-peptidase
MIGTAASPVRVLVTGFGPFPGVPYNASGTMLARLAQIPAGPRIEHFTEVIPVIWADARTMAKEAAARVKPHAILHFGVSKRLIGFEIEARAINMSGPKEDHAGVVRPGKPLHRSGQAFLNATAPPLAMLRALRQSGLPAQLSNDAGRYLCNALFYWSLLDAGPSGPLVSFVHMPVLGLEAEVQPRLKLEDCLQGALILIRASAQAVLRARQNGNGIRRGGRSDGSQVFHGTGRGSRRAVWHG